MQDNTVIARVEEQDCCGCGACFNKCPFGAIVMQENEEGFLHPFIDEDKCRNCGLCLEVCPSINASYDNYSAPACYAAMADDELRMKSSSGGVFTLLAEAVLEKGGQVCGAAYDDNWNVHHILVDNAEDLQKLRSSKYVQSSTDDCYQKIEVLLKQGTPVLFSGCPCQVAGLYSYLGKKYDELYTMDLICHGVPSRKLWREYLKENFGDKKIVNINLRDKSVFGWSTTMNVYFADNTELHRPANLDPYFQGFLPCMTLNKHCGKCFYSRLPRQGDISAGDWWGIDNFAKGLNDGNGTSQILINNEKGKKLYNSILPKLKNNKNIGLESAKKSINKTIFHPFTPSKFRKRFFEEFGKKSVSQVLTDCANDTYDVLLITFMFALNYGGVLVAYAVNRILKDLGYSVLMLQKPDMAWKGHPLDGTPSMNFAKKHYNISRIYHDDEDLVSLNDKCRNFIVGSDQIFHPYLLSGSTYRYLDFVKLYKNKIAFGSSFGHADLDIEPQMKIKINFLLQRFNALALRDYGDVFCQKYFNIKAESIIDPTLMLSAKVYEELAEPIDCFNTSDPYLLYFVLDPTLEKTSFAIKIADQLNLKLCILP